MKYFFYLILTITISAFIFTACKTSPKLYYCMSALTPLGGIEIDTSSPQIKDEGSNLRLTTDEGNVIIIPKSLCVEIIKAGTK